MTGQARHSVRRRIAEAQNWRCAYCGERLDWDTLTMDHIIPRSRGGRKNMDNLVAACSRCNISRKDDSAFLYWLARHHMEFIEWDSRTEFTVTKLLRPHPSIKRVAFVERTEGVFMAIARSA